MSHHDCKSDNRATGLSQEGPSCNTRGSSRREFMKSLAVAGVAGATISAGRLMAQPARPAAMAPGRIDVHNHMIPPFYMKIMEQERGGPLNAQGATQPWTPQTSLDVMDAAGVGVGMISITYALVGDSMSDGTPRANTLVRQSNEFGAQVVKDHPTRFGLFASLPMGDQDASLKEIEYSLDTLKADGIGLWNYYIDKWPGDPFFAPVFNELNRRKAIVFFHPMSSKCCGSLPFQNDVQTAGTINSLLMGGTFSRCPDIKFIFSHAGGAITVLWPRLTDNISKAMQEKVPNGVEYELKKLYFDTAKANMAPILDALKATVPVSQILYGSDAPVQKYSLTNPGLEAYAAKGGFTPVEWKAVQRGNAERLFPRLKIA
jgi:predicted TIM-barrel fold metal-dependent hydrolase